ncbi:hypothetical protein SynBIOSE41_03042 [Synechococcus sp. BIOS-E4-1]|uniref:hypothetical protein n=1 Tax=Synechococcus sp. BIOS-E4-1 TaxID=1400864 RepID=UPI0016465308|nr:hypothetical protein [Synechococcus sp. BIOS-E4-1]QNI55527.1 hypothetical protein SynBIOSE41_03042 [Synechococcus sp. BIOS-E4-1]
MLRFLLPGIGTALFSATLALSASAMEPLSVSATDQGNSSLSLQAEQAYFTQSTDDWSRSVRGVQLPEAGQERHQPPKGHTLLDLDF